MSVPAFRSACVALLQRGRFQSWHSAAASTGLLAANLLRHKDGGAEMVAQLTGGEASRCAVHMLCLLRTSHSVSGTGIPIQNLDHMLALSRFESWPSRPFATAFCVCSDACQWKVCGTCIGKPIASARTTLFSGACQLQPEQQVPVWHCLAPYSSTATVHSYFVKLKGVGGMKCWLGFRSVRALLSLGSKLQHLTWMP
jgi:hypothetical protein